VIACQCKRCRASRGELTRFERFCDTASDVLFVALTAGPVVACIVALVVFMFGGFCL
jgi:hypothetical protein